MMNRKTGNRKREILLKHCSLQSFLTLRKCPHRISSSRKKRYTSLITAIVLFFALCNNGCFGPRVEYNSPDPKLVGKVIHFTIPVTYLVLTEKDHAKDWQLRNTKFQRKKIVRHIVGKNELEQPNIMKQGYPSEDIKDGMGFVILGTYWIRKNPIDKAFSGEHESVLLQDENGILSVALMITLKNNSDM